MNRITLALVGAALALLPGGCAYRGAVYSEYSQVALDIRASQVSGAPVKVNFGYDRAVMAYIPKRSAESNSIQGEAVSVISWNNVGSDINPRHPTNTLLRVDAGFITGVAANVASAPSNATVVIVDPRLSTRQILTVEGTPGARMARAFNPTARFVSASQAELQDLLDRLDRRSEPDRNACFEQAAKIMPDEFQTVYSARTAANLRPQVAFLSAKNKYLADEPGDGPKHAKLIEALKASLK